MAVLELLLLCLGLPLLMPVAVVGTVMDLAQLGGMAVKVVAAEVQMTVELMELPAQQILAAAEVERINQQDCPAAAVLSLSRLTKQGEA
jgi:hypothetical protein